MARIKYAPGEEPLRNEHQGFTFQPNHYGQSMLSSQKNDRRRGTLQKKRMQNLQKAVRFWRTMPAATQEAWNTFAATYPQASRRNPAQYLTGYQLFIRRNSYCFLNHGIESNFMEAPSMDEIFPDTFSYEIHRDGEKLYLNYEFANWTSDNIVSVFLSIRHSSGRTYQNTQSRYVGYLENTRPQIILYGRLYNHYTTGDSRNFAPPGWHIPTITELKTLMNFLGGKYEAGGRMKVPGSDFWQSPNAVLPPYSGFGSKGTGMRRGSFERINISEKIWSTNSYQAYLGWELQMDWNATYASPSLARAWYGHSIHCLKNDSVNPGAMIGNDGTIYPTIKIGNQVWQAEPSLETKYRNGDPIPEIQDQSTWESLTSGAWCAYNNNHDYIGSSSPLPLILNITDLYIYNFGLLPQQNDNIFIKFEPMGKNNGQFFETVKSNTIII